MNSHSINRETGSPAADGKKEGMKHPFHDFYLSDALHLASNTKRTLLEGGGKFAEARALPDLTEKDLPEAIELLKKEIKWATFNWITGRVAMDLLRAASGEQVDFTP